MRVKTGEKLTLSFPFDILYRCSSCGKEVAATETLKATAHTGTIMGINLKGNLYGEAHDALMAHLAAVINPNNPRRFNEAGFTCRCRNCGHKEPWARMNYEKLNSLKLIFAYMAGFGGVILCFGADVTFNVMHMIVLGILAVGAVGWIGIQAYILRYNDKMAQLIAALPQESLPTILPHLKERHTGL